MMRPNTGLKIQRRNCQMKFKSNNLERKSRKDSMNRRNISSIVVNNKTRGDLDVFCDNYLKTPPLDLSKITVCNSSFISKLMQNESWDVGEKEIYLKHFFRDNIQSHKHMNISRKGQKDILHSRDISNECEDSSINM